MAKAARYLAWPTPNWGLIAAGKWDLPCVTARREGGDKDFFALPHSQVRDEKGGTELGHDADFQIAARVYVCVLRVYAHFRLLPLISVLPHYLSPLASLHPPLHLPSPH
jgi:hypothetical protein